MKSTKLKALNEAIDLSLYKETLLFLVAAGVDRAAVFPAARQSCAGLSAGGGRARALRSPGRSAGERRGLARLRSTSKPSTASPPSAWWRSCSQSELELSFERLRRLRRLVFGLGLAQVVVTTLIAERNRLGVSASLRPRR